MTSLESPLSGAPEHRERCRDERALAARALSRFLLCGSWTGTSGALVRELGGSADTLLIANALTRAAASWHGARAAIDRTLGQDGERERTVALADVLVESRETLGSWELVYALLERHAATPAGLALEPSLVDAALTLACARSPDSALETEAFLDAA